MVMAQITDLSLDCLSQRGVIKYCQLLKGAVSRALLFALVPSIGEAAGRRCFILVKTRAKPNAKPTMPPSVPPTTPVVAEAWSPPPPDEGGSGSFFGTPEESLKASLSRSRRLA